jgi:hypothetical protein
MKHLITAKLKLHTDSAQFQALRTTQLAYRDALNYTSQYAYELREGLRKFLVRKQKWLPEKERVCSYD